MCHANPHKQAFKTSQAKHWLIYTSIALLAACGAQESTNTDKNTDAAVINIASTATNNLADNAAPAEPSSDTKLLTSLAATYPNGLLPAERAGQAAADLLQNPAALKLTAGTAPVADTGLSPHISTQSSTPSQSIQAQSQLIQAQASSADYQPVQRIQNTTLYGAYFFSIYPGEVTTALATNPNWALEGPAFWASLQTGVGLYPVHRFQNKLNGSYLYTIYESERANIVASYSATFAYEGIAWNARQTTALGWSALYRFRNKTNGTYLFSAYESEKDAIVANYPTVFELEGIAYYVRQDTPIDPPGVPLFKYKLPDTGITSSQCYKAGSNVLSSCAFSLFSGTAYDLNFYQDGMVGLDKTTPDAADGKLGFSYSEVPNSAGGNFPKADCVKDNLTGLVWESKTTTGLRNKDVAYSNQIDDLGLNGFISAVNATSLCGYTDWRLPTVDELHSIVDYGIASLGPTIDATWFPNTRSDLYWSSSAVVGTPNQAWSVSLQHGFSFDTTRINTYYVRLVRGTNAMNQYIISTNGQEVTDSKTGLIWRRCSEGQVWSGSACTGSASVFMHEAALAHATAQTLATNVAWRLPNVKELASIRDVTKSAPTIDSLAFPATTSDFFWSSSPKTNDSNTAWGINFYFGYINGGYRNDSHPLRLLRSVP